MTPETAAARLSIALRPSASGQRAFDALAVYSQFAREVLAEAGADVLAEIVHTVERHELITRGAA